MFFFIFVAVASAKLRWLLIRINFNIKNARDNTLTNDCRFAFSDFFFVLLVFCGGKTKLELNELSFVNKFEAYEFLRNYEHFIRLHGKYASNFNKFSEKLNTHINEQSRSSYELAIFVVCLLVYLFTFFKFHLSRLI